MVNKIYPNNLGKKKLVSLIFFELHPDLLANRKNESPVRHEGNMQCSELEYHPKYLLI